jgi:trk system potassium uptake protein TrkA
MVIDNKTDRVELLKDDVAHAIALDATDKKALQAQNIQEMDAVVVAIGEDFEALLLTCVQLMDLEVPKIVARAANDQQRAILSKIGLRYILSPEEEVGKQLASQLLNPNIWASFPLAGDYEIVEVVAPRKVWERSVIEIDLRRKYSLNLVTIIRERQNDTSQAGSERTIDTIGVPRPETIIQAKDMLILFGKTQDIDRFIKT